MKKKKPTVKILVGYHRPAVLLKDEVLTPIHLGRALATEASKDGSMSKEDYQWMLDNMIGDDTGENISEENRKYCELTALYWAWKNYDKLGNPDYVGFMQYRRHFIFDDGFDGTGREKTWGCFRYSGIDDSYVDMLSLRGDKIVAYLEKHPADVLTTKKCRLVKRWRNIMRRRCLFSIRTICVSAPAKQRCCFRNTNRQSENICGRKSITGTTVLL